ncbi:MAG: transposase family protein [Verrucomicrobia bacterium]|nr:transposase family protein [Verrucomicrobiota bacterium]MBT5063035.1 transposase family protein [Verrucomicrobiota bacterium]MBT5480833.1 transposase family protein [Verrucomicrobiota bacterium]MBT7536462.1 transposase family protein [Verrucomicrobiota bacterium]MBT7875136.1 transposase family protein [Verrucomicrobiota bacterium]
MIASKGPYTIKVRHLEGGGFKSLLTIKLQRWQC